MMHKIHNFRDSVRLAIMLNRFRDSHHFSAPQFITVQARGVIFVIKNVVQSINQSGELVGKEFQIGVIRIMIAIKIENLNCLVEVLYCLSQ